MSLEQKLTRKYQKDALISDMGGYGLGQGLTGGYATNDYQQQLYNTVAGNGQSGGGRKRGRPRKVKGGAMQYKIPLQDPSGGEMSGGFPFAAAFAAIPAVISAIKAIRGSGGIYGQKEVKKLYKGGKKSMLSQMKEGLPPFMDMGQGLSGGMSMGYDLSSGYPRKYKGSFPMPGFSPPPDGYTRDSRQMMSGSAGVAMGQGLSGGAKQRRKAYAYKSPAQLAWQKKLEAYRKSHPGSSLMDAMKACKGK